MVYWLPCFYFETYCLSKANGARISDSYPGKFPTNIKRFEIQYSHKDDHIYMMTSPPFEVETFLTVTQTEFLIRYLHDPDFQKKWKVCAGMLIFSDEVNMWEPFFLVYIERGYLNQICHGSSLPIFMKSLVHVKHGNNEHHSVFNNDRIYKARPNYYIPVNLQLPFKLQIAPRVHQLNNLIWMLEIENQIDRGQHVFQFLKTDAHFDKCRIANKNFYITKKTSICYTEKSLWDQGNYTRQVTFTGGVLCDKVGLGKTLSMILLIMWKHFHSKQQSKPVRFKRISPKQSSAVSAKEISPYLSPSRRARTLIIVPRRLCDQWLTEVDKYLGDDYPYDFRVTTISTIAHIKKRVDKNDIASYDLVIASYDLFNNSRYNSQSDLRLEDIEWERIILDEGHEIIANFPGRKVNKVMNKLLYIRCKYRWLCTGTPFPYYYSSFEPILRFLSARDIKSVKPSDSQISVSIPSDYDVLLYGLNPTIVEQLIEQIFRCTDVDPLKESTAPKLRHETVFMDFSLTEMAVYKSAANDPERQVQLCTSILVSEMDSKIFGGQILSLDEVNKAMLEFHRKSADESEVELDQLEEEYEEYEEKYQTELDRLDNLISKTSNKILKKDYREERSKLKASFKGHTKTVEKHREKLEEKIQYHRDQTRIFMALDFEDLSKKNCPISGKPFTDVVILPTGYTISGDTAEMLFSNREAIDCPFTRIPIQKKQIVIVKDIDTAKAEADAKAEAETDDAEINRWGTKLTKVVEVASRIVDDFDSAKNCLPNKIIIFSQKDKMLNLVSNALSENGIKHVFCRGNVHQMSASIRKFRADSDYRIILLSSDKCSSGSNLIEANHVFLLDTTCAEARETIEQQAIARAFRFGQTRDVTVTRFVVRDTVEFDTLKNLNTQPVGDAPRA